MLNLRSDEIEMFPILPFVSFHFINENLSQTVTNIIHLIFNTYSDASIRTLSSCGLIIESLWQHAGTWTAYIEIQRQTNEIDIHNCESCTHLPIMEIENLRAIRCINKSLILQLLPSTQGLLLLLGHIIYLLDKARFRSNFQVLYYSI